MKMDETFAAALRELLVEQVEASHSLAHRGATRRRRWPAGFRRPAALGLALGALVPVLIGGLALVLLSGRHAAQTTVAAHRSKPTPGSRVAPALQVYAAFRRPRRAADRLPAFAPTGGTLTGESRRVLATRTQEWWLVPSSSNPPQVCLTVLEPTGGGGLSGSSLGGGSGSCEPIGVLHAATVATGASVTTGATVATGATFATGVEAGHHPPVSAGPFVRNLVLPVQYVGLEVRFANGATQLARPNADGAIAYTTHRHVIASHLLKASTTLPGGSELTKLAAPVTATRMGTQTVQLGPAPAGTTSIVLDLTCLTAGTFSFPGGASSTCEATDAPSTASYTVRFTPGHDSTTITTTPRARWRLVATYANLTATIWPRNASGQTYGVENAHGSPDLIRVIATNGRQGYAYASTLMYGPTGRPPANPAAAVAQNGRPYTVTVYESDGKTPIGTFTTDG